jgi:hypothetical protein
MSLSRRLSLATLTLVAAAVLAGSHLTGAASLGGHTARPAAVTSTAEAATPDSLIWD